MSGRIAKTESVDMPSGQHLHTCTLFMTANIMIYQ